MIKNIRHKGLRRFYEDGETKGVEARYISKIQYILQILEAASAPEDITAPQLKLHPLVGDLKGYWSVTVSANWRIMFRFEGRDICDVELIDYH